MCRVDGVYDSTTAFAMDLSLNAIKAALLAHLASPDACLGNLPVRTVVTVLGLVDGARGAPRFADSSAAGAGRTLMIAYVSLAEPQNSRTRN